MWRCIVRRRANQWLCGAGLAIAAGCGGGAGETSGPPVVVPVLTLTKLTVTLSVTSVQPGQTASATATGADQNGASIATGTITWTSSNPAVATVTSSGTNSATITALSAGTTQITATSASGVTSQTPLTVTAVSTGGGSSVNLTAAGQSTAFVTSPNINVNLAVTAGSQYLITVVNTDPSYTFTEDFMLSGNLGAVSSLVATVPPVTSVSPELPRTTVGELPPAVRRARAALRNHLGVLDDNRHVFARFGSPRVAWSRASATAGRRAPISAAIVPTIGAVNKVYVKNAIVGDCTSVDSIGARTVAVGQHVILLADTNRKTWPQPFRPDSSFYQTFANEFDQITYPHIIANVGDPLAYDKSLNGLGKITVTFTPVLNNFASDSGGGSIVAFVNGCDFFPFATSGVDADLSNQTEMFYSWVPAANGADTASWAREVRATAAHEVKHIVSYTDRIINDSQDFEEIWLEEGLAQESSEIWERNFSQATWKGRANFLQTVACEINLGTGAPCDVAGNKPITLLAGHLPFFFDYLQTESSSHSEGLGLDTPSNYGAGWSIARWATDQYASSGEGPFIKSLVNEPRLVGLPNLSAHTGQAVPLLLTYWNLATAIFQTPAFTFADQRATIPSFDFANIFRIGQTGLTCNNIPCGIFTDAGTPVYPIQPIPLASGAISNTVRGVPGTSAVFYLLTAASAGTQSVQLVSTTGAALNANSGFRIAILRVK